ncbi:hypothetical protein M427DRAFT_44919 [Gonapodya prolifera JEL478]|uniref:Uncharacterized protein n=1 Tax=Gonapodya prolifera (strain JEL478) TaxID=1344416 RepID=A0A139AD64_GONPJ|nr:hypothetical protein M427DRAFT_44919 [Gonapodya prolifera JEL478]|eukprot:KXS14741.1 hypothetical protein M427DRAFT_44919 [Gonapodya prolifera JEL478]
MASEKAATWNPDVPITVNAHATSALTGKVDLLGGLTKDAMTAVFSLYIFVTFFFLIASLKPTSPLIILGVMLLFALSIPEFMLMPPRNTPGVRRLPLRLLGWNPFWDCSTRLFLGEWFQYPVLPEGDLSGFWPQRAERARRIQSEATILVSS